MCRRKQQKTISAKINKTKYRCQNSSNLRTGKIIQKASGKHGLKGNILLRQIETIAERAGIKDPTALHHCFFLRVKNI